MNLRNSPRNNNVKYKNFSTGIYQGLCFLVSRIILANSLTDEKLKVFPQKTNQIKRIFSSWTQGITVSNLVLA